MHNIISSQRNCDISPIKDHCKLLKHWYFACAIESDVYVCADKCQKLTTIGEYGKLPSITAKSVPVVRPLVLFVHLETPWGKFFCDWVGIRREMSPKNLKKWLKKRLGFFAFLQIPLCHPTFVSPMTSAVRLFFYVQRQNFRLNRDLSTSCNVDLME